MLEIHAIRREDLLTAFSLSAVLRLRRRFQALAELYRQQRGNTSCEAANRRNEKKALSAAASFFPFRLLLRGLKGASSPFLVGPARRNRWWFSGSLLARKRELSPAKKRSTPAHRRENQFWFSFGGKREPYSAFFKNSGSSFPISASAFPRWLMASFSSGVSWA